MSTNAGSTNAGYEPSSQSAKASGNADQLREQAAQLSEAAKEKMQQVGQQARQLAEENFDQFRDSASEYFEQGKHRAMDMERDLEAKIREQPVKSLLVAAGCGLLLGVLLARR